MELVTIIIPVYNGEKYLEETIKSCLAQEYPNIEILIINDASSDQSELIINSFNTDDRIIRVKNDNNMGLMYNLNLGIQMAHGTKILPLGQDDMLQKHHIEEMMECFAYNDISFAFNNPIRIDSFGKQGNKVLSDNDLKRLLKNPNYEISRNCCIPSTGLIYDRKTLLECGGYDQRFRNYGEWIVWIKLLSKKKCGFSDSCNALYRTHEDNLTSTQLNNKTFSKELIKYQLYCQKLAIRVLDNGFVKKILLCCRYGIKRIRSKILLINDLYSLNVKN